MLMSVRDMDVLRLLCWCQNVRPDDLSSISTETERENLITLGLIKRHQRSDTLLLTNSGRAFLQAALEGDVPNLTLSYHDAAIERRVRLSALMMTAYHAGINVFTITANSLAEPSTLFITAITRSRGHNPWGSARVGAIAHLGSTYYAVHYIYSGIGRMAVNDELAAFHNHTNFGKDTQRAFLFAGASYADIIEELKVRDEKRDKGGYNMSIKSQEGHMRQLALLLTTDLGCIFDERESGPNGSKKAFLNVGKVFLRTLAKDLGLHEVTVSANSGGIAVSGTCSLYGMWEDRGIAVWIEQRLCADGKVLCYRTIRSSRDFKGGYNHFLTSSDLKTWSYPQLLETLSALRKDGCRYERAA